MPFWRTYYHLIWATQGREPWLQPEIEPDLFTYLTRKASELDVFVHAISGWFDHIHLIVSIPPHHSVAEVVKLLKGASSHDLKLAGALGSDFAWQRGYGVLTLGDRQRKDAEAYVRDQKTHHAQMTTNAWLEYETSADEGPAEASGARKGVSTGVHEEAAPYSIGDSPF